MQSDYTAEPTEWSLSVSGEVVFWDYNPSGHAFGYLRMTDIDFISEDWT